MGHRTIMAFDIETVPDAAAASRLLNLGEQPEADARQLLEAYHAEQTDGRSSFPKPPFHQVVVAGILLADVDHSRSGAQITVRGLDSRAAASDDEAELVRWFFEVFERERPQLVSFNGRGFDLPVLKYRAMVHGIPCALLHDTTNKWENYGSRYALDWHCDLLEALSDHGASPRVRLDEICAALGLPGKLSVDGSQVCRMFEAGHLDEIAAYCEQDVLCTYLLYLRLMHHKGRLDSPSYNDAVSQMLDFLRSLSTARPHVRDFGVAWKQASRGSFGLVPVALPTASADV